MPLLTDPAPTSEEMSEVYKGALRAPDHARLRPWKFIEVRGDSRDKLAKIFIDTNGNFALDENESTFSPDQDGKFNQAVPPGQHSVCIAPENPDANITFPLDEKKAYLTWEKHFNFIFIII